MVRFIVVVDEGDEHWHRQLALVVALGHQLVAAGAGINAFSYEAGDALAATIDLDDPLELLFGLFACQQLPRLYDDLEEDQAVALALVNDTMAERLSEMYGADLDGAWAVTAATRKFRDELLAFGWFEGQP